MATITVHSILMNAAAKLPHGRERRLLDRVAEMLDYRSFTSDDDFRDFGAQVIEFEDDASATEIGAICPYCKREPCPIQCNPVQFGPVPVLQFTCSGCRKVLGLSIVPPPPMMMPEQRQSSGLVLPPH
jgi:hypothetical protein